MSAWDFLLKYSGVVSLGIAFATFCGKLYSGHRRPSVSDVALFAFTLAWGDPLLCIYANVGNPSSKPLSITSFSVSSYTNDKVFRSDIDPFLILGTKHQGIFATALPLLLSPGETKRIVLGFHLEPEDISVIGLTKVYTLAELEDTIQYPPLYGNQKEYLQTADCPLLCQLHTHHKAYSYDIEARYLNLYRKTARLAASHKSAS